MILTSDGSDNVYGDDAVWGTRFDRDHAYEPTYANLSEMRRHLESESCNECGGWGIDQGQVNEDVGGMPGSGEDNPLGSHYRTTTFSCKVCYLTRDEWTELVVTTPNDIPKPEDHGDDSDEVRSDEDGWDLEVDEHGELVDYDEPNNQRDDGNRARNKSTHFLGQKVNIRKEYVQGDILCLMSPKKSGRNIIASEEEIKKLKRMKHRTGSGGWSHPQNPEFRARNLAREYLDRGGGKVESELRLVSPETDWESEITGVIWGADVNKRSLKKREDGIMMVPHGRTRWCLETYISMSCDNHLFWFFGDFIERFLVHEDQVDRHLSEGHPFNRKLILGKVEGRNNEASKRVEDYQVRFIFEALSRKFGFEPWTDLPPQLIDRVDDEIWEKIKLRGRGDSEGVGLRYWVPYEDEELSEEGGENWVHGGLRKQSGLHLSHIPIAYMMAQMIYDHGANREIQNYLKVALQILKMIWADLDWCDADRATMDNWWDGIITKRDGSPEGSVTKLGR